LGRLTAPVAGEDYPDKHANETAKAKADSVADKVKEQGNEAAEEAKTAYGKIKSSIGNIFGGKKSEEAPR
jgi:hypothetical protein